MKQGAVSTREHGKGWQYYFSIASIKGKTKKVYKGGFKSEKEAYKAGIIAQQEYFNNGRKQNSKSISVSDYMSMWLEDLYRSDIQLTTYEGYKKILNNHIIPSIGKYYMQTIDAVTLQALLKDMSDNGYTYNVIVEVSGILKKAFREAYSFYKIINHNPAENLAIPKKANKKASVKTTQNKNSWIAKENMDKIFERFPEGHVYFIPLILGYRCGLRLGECFGVCWSDINFDKAELTVNRQMQFSNTYKTWYVTTPKYEEIRVIHLDENTLEILKHAKQSQEKYKQQHPKYVKIFENTENGIRKLNNIKGKELDLINRRADNTILTPDNVKHLSRVVHYDLGIKEFTFHSLRHTHISELVANGVPITDIVARTGHKNVKEILETYLHSTDKTKSVMTNIIDNMYN